MHGDRRRWGRESSSFSPFEASEKSKKAKWLILEGFLRSHQSITVLLSTHQFVPTG